MKIFICSYRFRDTDWSLEIPADSEFEALARLSAIGSTGKVDGILRLSIPVVPSWLRRLLGR